MRDFVTPSELMRFHDEQGVVLSNSEYIRSPQNQHLKDVWCAARFALGYERHVKKPCLVCVNEIQSSDTDFVIRVGSEDFPFQTTIADDPKRRMGDEHRDEPDRESRTHPYEPERHRLEGPRWVAAAIERKLEKNYSDIAHLNLLVYANLHAHNQTYANICSSVENRHRRFESVWIITNHQICSVYSSSRLGSIESLADIADWGRE